MEHHDDSSHYEVSLTATQALVAFVLLLFSLAASFGFGVVVGKGRGADGLVVRREPAVVTEAGTARGGSKIVELGVGDPQPPAVATTDAVTAPESEMAAPAIIDEDPPATDTAAASAEEAPFYAQLLSTSEPKAAEALAARLIERGFTSAFVDQASTDQGTVYRVRVKFPGEAAARAAVEQLKAYSPGEVWLTGK
jgi:cell division septation protein DedD